MRPAADRLGFGSYAADCYQGNLERTAPRDLAETLCALAEDHDYLLTGGAFSEELIDQWIALKRKESAEVAGRPHPHEYTLYYDL